MKARPEAPDRPVPGEPGSRSVTPAGPGLPALSTRALEDRQLIHRNDSVRAQADAFRGLRTKLLAMGDGRNTVILVAPVQPGCGGSFVARNLAAAFAFDDTKTVLLIDCDALHPTQHAALGIDAANGGMMDYLDGSISDLGEIQYDSGLPRLRLVPNSTPRETTGEYFSSPRMRTMIDSLRGTHPNRYLILDSPPALDSPDARILSELADLVVLVAGHGQVTIDRIDDAAANFDPEKVAGVVFNNIY
ncbi:polysaccharide biosynthesis protein [Luteimonas dalianensis]|uniref:polysaccharide biosynthesis protein n=1 Tax=Luteimonas dalianensis TaxID=1148196 RepID=UPI003BF0508B